jgi:uncharacterized protein YjbI with pentapeptide repeats
VRRATGWMRSPTGLVAIGVVVTAVAAGSAIIVLSSRTGEWTALKANAPLIAAVIALGGVGTAQMVSIALADYRAQDEALQTYLAEMSELLLDKCLHEKSAEFDPARVTARLQTLAVLERLDAGRKRTVLLFLREAQLIHRYKRLDTTAEPAATEPKVFYAHYVGLREADLSKADLRGARLISASGQHPVSLKGANLKGAELFRANLCGADLSEANLRRADLRCADLSASIGAPNEERERTTLLFKADLKGAKLRGTKLHGADLRGALHLTQRQLKRANGDENTKLPLGCDPPKRWKNGQQAEGN